MADKAEGKGSVDPEVITGDDIIDSEPEYTDARYDEPVAAVIPSEKAGQYEVKQWPMLGEFSDGETNALGYPSDYFEQRRALARQKKLIEQKKAEEARLEREERKRSEEAAKAGQEGAAAPALTAGQLDEIRAQAAKEGHDEGFAKGHEEGLKQGMAEGVKQGEQKGFAEGSAKGLEAGYAKGREEGFQKGRAEGLSQGEEVVLEQSERFRHLADALANPLREVDRDVTDRIVMMISKLAGAVIRREVRGDPGFLRATVERAVAALPDPEGGAEITMNPDDAALIEASAGREYMASQHWKIKVSQDLAPGDVTVSSGGSTVRSRLSERIDAICADFVDASSEAVESAAREEIPGSPAWDAKKEEPLDVPQDLKDLMEREARAQAQQPLAGGAEEKGGPAGDAAMAQHPQP
ncbi:MAG: FliH/SctL family protein, partial [Succinivibrio sp.]